MSILEFALDPSTVSVAVNPGKAFIRVWISNGSLVCSRIRCRCRFSRDGC